MIRNSDETVEICTTNSLLSIPIDGRWIWDEKKKELVYERRRDISKEKQVQSNELLKIDLRTGLPINRRQYRPLERIIKTKDNNKITLVDVIRASLNVMSEIFYIPIEFEEYLRTPQVNEYFLYLLNYFHWFFEITNNASPNIEKHIDRSQREKYRISQAYAHLLVSLRELGCKYATLLLGIDLKDFHHMRSGDLFYSCANIDRTIHESLFIFSTYFIWITFYRENFTLIRMELARLFRAGGDVELIKIPTAEVDLYAREFDKQSPYYHQNHLHDILVKQLKKDNKINEQSNRNESERFAMKQLISPSSYRHSFTLPPPSNPLDDSRILNKKNYILPTIQFELMQNVGILGKPYSEFDSIRLRLKLNIEEDVIIPKEFLVTLPNETIMT
ncbi:hypothetical protein I4U23_008023 [Adineta vaga]|nr:hypothetical protein I4U23_008023 [Adineta vaga]